MSNIQQHNILRTYMRYSKRIAVFGIVQWAIIAAVCIVFVWVMGSTENNLTETLMSLANNIIVNSSAIAIATSSGYYAHSAYDEKLKKKVELALSDKDEKETENEEEDTGVENG